MQRLLPRNGETEPDNQWRTGAATANDRGCKVVRQTDGVALLALLSITAAASVHAQGNPNQFGAQDRANAASQMIVLGVQQGISSLPPTSGQSFTYTFDADLGTYVPSAQLGPTSLRSPQTVGAGKFSFRFATSYFDLSETKGPIPYLVSQPPGNPLAVAALGLHADAKVGLINLSVNYGVTNRFEMMMNVPVVIVDAQASNIYTAAKDRPTDLAGVPPAADLNQAIKEGALQIRQQSFNEQGFNFNEGTHAGVGRISLGVKGLLYADKIVEIAPMLEFYLPSPSEAEFAGSNSAAILPRLVTAFKLADRVRLHVDAGYDYDFDNNELRRFVWNFGPSLALAWGTLDAGVGGSKFNQGITWTPATAPYVGYNGPGTIQALADNTLGSNYVDALGGIKIRLNDRSVISGAVNVPINNEGFRAAAVGTVAAEFYF